MHHAVLQFPFRMCIRSNKTLSKMQWCFSIRNRNACLLVVKNVPWVWHACLSTSQTLDSDSSRLCQFACPTFTMPLSALNSKKATMHAGFLCYPNPWLLFDIRQVSSASQDKTSPWPTLLSHSAVLFLYNVMSGWRMELWTCLLWPLKALAAGPVMLESLWELQCLLVTVRGGAGER